MRYVTVFCSSSNDVSPMFFSEMELLAGGLAKNNIGIVYGGAAVGLMGHMADKALEAGGKVIGVIPGYLNKEGIVHKGLSELIVVGNLMDRKRKMIELGEAIVAFPGGVGTIDEITEALALKQLGEIKHPAYFLNFLDFWRPFLDCLTEIQAQKMIHQNFDELFQVVDSSESLIEDLNKK